MSGAYFSLASGSFSQDWSNASLITADDNWAGVPSIVGFRGDDITGSAGIDPRTLTGDGTVTVDVIANQTNPATLANGGVAEFAIANPTIALNGSGTADAPNLVLYMDATGRKNVHLELDVRDLDASTDNATQQFNIQYRVGETGAWTNVPGGYLADATTGPSAATLVTHVAVDLPAAANGQGQLQIRLMTTNAVGNDEWVGLDNIVVTSDAMVGASVAVGNVSITEGDSGDQLLTFTITRSNADGAFSVDYGTQDGTASAGSDYEAVSGTLNFEVGGALSQTVSVVIHGDTTVEPNEAFNLLLSNVVNTTSTASLLNTSATGTINNDDFTLLAIHDIQGAGHTSPFVGQHVVTTGIVTAIDTTGARGFWIQDPNPDANDATSEGIFVFTGATPTVAVGDSVRVEGNVNEFKGSDPNNLTVTELDSPVISVLSSGTALPAAIILGTGGRLVPTEVIDNDHFTVFDPGQDAVDFYESLEGMRVTVPDAQATAPTITNTTWIVANQGANATGMNAGGGITISAGDFNPERVQIFFDSGVSPAGVKPNAITGDHLGDVTGILHYFGGDYELLPTAIGSTGSGPIVLPRETTTLAGDADHITIGAFNVENLDPFDPQAKIDALAANIRVNLGSPDIIGVEEIQDADGPGAGTNYSGAASAQKLIDAIVAGGGPHYVYVEVAPTANNTTGGENNGNIRQGYLYNPDRVGFVSVSQITDTTPANGDAYNNSRRPLVGVFTFHGETITLVDVHNTSRGGSDALFGLDQPALNAGDDRRVDQTSFVKTFVEGLVAADPHANVVVMGDFNAFQFETTLTQLESSGALTNLTNLLPVNERYSYNFDGNNQQLDHMLASPELYASAQFDIVHLNSNQAVVNQTTDHDGSVSRFLVNAAPVAMADSFAGSEDTALVVDAQHGLAANDSDLNGDALTVVLQDGPLHGTLALAADGSFTYTPAANFNGPDSFTYLVKDPSGAMSEVKTVSLQVAAVNDAPVANADAASVTEDETVVIDVLGNDTDVDVGDDKVLVSVSATAKGASVSIVDGMVVYSADADAFDLLGPGQSTTDTLTYTMRDAAGATSTATVTVTINGAPDGPAQFGGNGADTLQGTGLEERMEGGNGADSLMGMGGSDTLLGGNGADVLDGGAGADRLDGGLGPDTFVFSGAFGRDVVVGLSGEDHIQLSHLQFADFNAVLAHSTQVGGDVVITLDAANTITLQAVSLANLHANDFLFV